MLDHELRSSTPPFEVFCEEQGPTAIRRLLGQPGEFLFHLHDPWGSNRLEPSADRWSNELPKLVGERAADRKFLITSRWDILQLTRIDPTLARLVEMIEPEDYSSEALGLIYNRMAADLQGFARNIAKRSRDEALRHFQRPYEIDRFINSLRAEDAKKPRRPADLIQEAQIESVAAVVAQQVRHFRGGPAVAAFLWGLLRARSAIGTKAVGRILRRYKNEHGLRPDVDGLSSFLEAGGNLRRTKVIELVHPRVQEGLELAMTHSPRVAEETIEKLAETLLGMDAEGEDWGAETALTFIRAAVRLPDLQPVFESEALDRYLLTRLQSESSYELQAALADLAAFGSERSPAARLAKLLLEGDDPDQPIQGFRLWNPPELNESDIAKLRDSAGTDVVIRAFLMTLSRSTTFYAKSLIDFLSTLGGRPSDFMTALNRAVARGRVAHNLDVIVVGACRSSDEAFDQVIDLLLADEKEAEEWFESIREDLRQAWNYETDAATADHIEEEPQERFYNAEEGLQAAVLWRLDRVGDSWLAKHEHATRLAEAAAAGLRTRSNEVPPALLKGLLTIANSARTRSDVFTIVGRDPAIELADPLAAALAASDMPDHLRRTLIDAATAMVSLQPHLMAQVAQSASPLRRIELGADLLRREGRRSPFKSQAEPLELAAAYFPELSEAEQQLARAIYRMRNGDEISAAVAEAGKSAAQLAAELLDGPIGGITPELLCFGALSRIDIAIPAKSILDGGDAEQGDKVVIALAMSGSKAASDLLWNALDHPKQAVRRTAFRYLIETADAGQREKLVRAGADPSAYVRLDWAEQMGERQWPEAQASLVALVGDERDFTDQNGYIGYSWPRFQVARTAARSLGRYEVHSGPAIETLIAAASAPSRDPFVACAAISALATISDSRAAEVLRTALTDEGLDGDDRYRPRAQAAAWAFFDRAIHRVDLSAQDIAALEGAALDTNPKIAGASLLALAFSLADAVHAVLKRLGSGGLTRRTELLHIGSAMAGKPLLGGGGEPDLRLLAQLGQGEEVDRDSAAFKALERWLSKFNGEEDVAFITRWISNVVITGSNGDNDSDVRDFDLPQRLPVLSLRSMTGGGERLGRDEGV